MGGRLQEALDNIRAAIQNAPDNPEAYNTRADLHRRTGREDEAAADEAVAARLRARKTPDQP